MKAIILAAGRGSRLNTLTQDRPKCLVELYDKPLLSWQLEALRANNIQEIAIVRGYLANLLNFPELKKFDNLRWTETNMVNSLQCATEWLREEICIVSYADIIYSAEIVKQLVDGTGDIMITYDPHWLALWQARFSDPLSDAETFRIDNQGKLLDIGGKTKSVEEIQGQYMGLLKFSPTGWQQIENLLSNLDQKTVDKLDMTAMLKLLITVGVGIQTVAIESQWFEIDSASDIEVFYQRFKKSD